MTDNYTFKKISTAEIISQENLLLQMLIIFYKKENNLNEMLKVITNNSKISLRIIDWFVTNYAKENGTYYELKNDLVSSKRVHVYNDYKLKLKSYGKKSFDPFCRTERIYLPYKDNEFIITTIGQLNFFKWIIELNMLQYILDNYTEIEKDMKKRGSISKKKTDDTLTLTTETNMNATEINNCNTNESKKMFGVSSSFHTNKTRKKREELSVSSNKNIKREFIEVVLEFK